MKKQASYPEQIERLNLDLAATTRDLAEAREQIDVIEHLITLEVLNARAADGKPAYSNETARAAAIKSRLLEHEQHRQLRRHLLDLEQAKAEALARLERARGEFKLHLLDRQTAIASQMTMAS